MSKKNKKNQNEEVKVAQEEIQDQEALNTEQQANEQTAPDDPEKKIADLEAQVEHEKKEYLFLMADFENFRKRTLKEKADLIKNGAESAMRDLLPVVDDLERAIDSTGKDFDTDVHEAVTMFPAPDPSMKGKVIDTTIKGYMINDKVLRHAKVVVGS